MKFSTFKYNGAKYGKTPINAEFLESLSVSDLISYTKVFLVNLLESLGIIDTISKMAQKDGLLEK